MSEYEYLGGRGGIKSNGKIFLLMYNTLGRKKGSEIIAHSLVHSLEHKPNKQY